MKVKGSGWMQNTDVGDEAFIRAGLQVASIFRVVEGEEVI
jgi:hypothetical protein